MGPVHLQLLTAAFVVINQGVCFSNFAVLTNQDTPVTTEDLYNELRALRDECRNTKEQMKAEIDTLRGRVRELENHTGEQFAHKVLNDRIQDIREDVNHLQDDVEVSNERMLRFNSRMDELENTDNKTMPSFNNMMDKLENTIDYGNLAARVMILEKGIVSSRNDSVAFHAVLTKYTSYRAGDIVVFNKVDLDIGKGYDPNTGVFTVPPGGDGLYFFSFHALVQPGNQMNFELCVNDVAVSAGTGGYNLSSSYGTAGSSAVVKLRAGNTVYIRIHYTTDGTSLYVYAHYIPTAFSGFKIYN